MPKDTFYFQHDYNARNDEKILELRSRFGAEGYGVFWMIVETMAEDKNGGLNSDLIGGLSLGYGVAKAKLSKIFECCVELGLLKKIDGKYVSDRLLEYKKFRKSMAKFGKEGAQKRWGGHSHPNAQSNANNSIG